MDLIVETLSAFKWNPLNYTSEEIMGLLAALPLMGAVGFGIGRLVENHFAELRMAGPIARMEVPPHIRYTTVAGCFLLGLAAHVFILYLF